MNLLGHTWQSYLVKNGYLCCNMSVRKQIIQMSEKQLSFKLFVML